jgi:hypothetical protein
LGSERKPRRDRIRWGFRFFYEIRISALTVRFEITLNTLIAELAQAANWLAEQACLFYPESNFSRSFETFGGGECRASLSALSALLRITLHVKLPITPARKFKAQLGSG